MDIALLKTFKVVIEEGTTQRAAARLHCVQSNVTARLKQLETDLGTPVFARRGRRLELNEAGRALLPFANQILSLVEQARLSAGQGMQARRTLRLGAPESVASLRLADVLVPFHQRHPDIDITLETRLTVELVKSLLDYRLDAILVAGPIMHDELDNEPVFEEELVLISEPGAAPLRTPADVATQTVLMFQSSCPYRKRFEQWLASAGVTPRPIIPLGAYGTILGCVAAGMGVSLLPRGLAESYLHRHPLQIHTLDGMDPATIHLVLRKHETPSPATADFRDELRRHRNLSQQHMAAAIG